MTPNTGAGNAAPGGGGNTAPGTSGTTGGSGTSGTPARGTAGSTPVTGGRGGSTAGTAAPAAGSGTPQAGAGTPMAGTGSTPMAGTGAPPAGGGTTSVLEHHTNASRDGMSIQPTFTRAAAAKIKRDPMFMATMSGPTFAQPLYVEGAAGGKDVVIVATEQNEVSAFDAMTGAMVWKKMLGATSAAGGGPGGCPLGNISPLGITGTPVVDAASRTLFLNAMVSNKHQIFALSVDDGATKAGWPVDAGTAMSGSLAFAHPAHNQRGALTILNGTVYVPYGGHFGDCGEYHGWVVGVPIANPKAPIGWATRAVAGGIWAPSGVASDGKSIWAATGNTMARPSASLPSFSSPGMFGDGESIVRLPPDLKFSTDNKDFFAPQNWAALDSSDLDVGGSGVVLFSVPGATPSNLAIALGKDGSAFLANRDNLGGVGSGVAITKFSGDQIIQAPVAYTTPTGTFVAARARGTMCPSGAGAITALKISAASPPAISTAWCGGATSTGSPMVTTTDGMSESIIWYVAGTKLIGLNGETGAAVFDGGAAGDAVTAASKWQTPIAAKGRIYFASNNQLYAFAL
ncbi:MAG TPA: hypothetical protein VJV78_28720 [Polyangiales bacterium]|nr:hypothetical protein [Polyangiales bacterium]